MHAYHSTRLAHNLTHDDARSRPSFWAQIRAQMSQRGCQEESEFWQHSWQQMATKLIVCIEKARRLKWNDSSWLTQLNSQLMAVLLDTLDGTHLAFVERCMAEDVRDEDDRLSLCATVFWDLIAERFVIRCQHCRQTFGDADELLAHVRRYYDYDAAEKRDDDRMRVTVTRPIKPPVVEKGDDDLVLVTMTSPIKPPLIEIASSCDESDDPAPAQETPSVAKPPAESSQPDLMFGTPADFGFMSDSNNSASSDISAAHNDPEPGEPLKTSKRAPVIDDGISIDESRDDDDGFLGNIKGLRKPRKNCTIKGCRLTFRTYRGLNRHVRAVHNQGNAFHCPHCPRKLFSENKLELHLLGHEHPAECDICQRKFADKTSLVSHMQMHYKSAIFPCKECGRMFRTKGVRYRHMQVVHGKGRPESYICEQCGLHVRNKQQLQRHMITHTDSRPYKCDLCGQFFRDQKYVATHIQRIHTRDTPFQCRYDGCTESYRYHDTRLRHEINVHGGSGLVVKTPEYL